MSVVGTRRAVVRALHPWAEATCHYPHLLRSRISSADVGLRKPRSGGLFIARAAPPAFVCFLFFGGADLRYGPIQLRFRRRRKTKNKWSVGPRQSINRPTLRVFKPAAAGERSQLYSTTSSIFVGNDKGLNRTPIEPNDANRLGCFRQRFTRNLC